MTPPPSDQDPVAGGPTAPRGAPDQEDGGVPDTSELLEEVHALRSTIERFERRRRRMGIIMLVAFLTLVPLGVLGTHLVIDYESGRVADAIEKSSGPFTDEALRRVCREIKIPLFGPETKKRLHCPSSESGTTETTTPTTTEAPSTTP